MFILRLRAFVRRLDVLLLNQELETNRKEGRIGLMLDNHNFRMLTHTRRCFRTSFCLGDWLNHLGDKSLHQHRLMPVLWLQEQEASAPNGPNLFKKIFS